MKPAYEGHVELYEDVEYFATRKATCKGCAFDKLRHCIYVRCDSGDGERIGFIYLTKINYITHRLIK